MKRRLSAFVILMMSASAFGQGSIGKTQVPHTTEVDKCSQHLKMEELQAQDPARFASMISGAVEPIKKQFEPKSGSEKLTGIIYTIPVVFHVLHNNGAENISDAQLIDAIAILNRDYRLLNADANSVDAQFTGMPTDVEIEFKLAKVAPNGACFNGITRTVTALTSNGSSGQNQVNAVIAGNNVFQGVWPHNKYLNIYIAAEIGGAAGYTFNPNGTSAATAANMYYNGIFALHNYTGTIGTSSPYSGRTLTHEVGHWLNLAHVWGANNNPGSAGCSGTDNVQDTPDTQGSTSCNLNANTCSTDDAYWGMAKKDNVENYMDYSYCSKMFTQGQVTRMRAAIVSSVGGRSNIWTTANLQAVGAIPGSSLCAIDFSSNLTTVCSGTTVTYTPNTTSGISTYAWSFPGGTPSTSSASNPTVTYNTAGTYNASLTVTSSSNGTTYPVSKTNYMTVNVGTVVSLPISEGFTTATFPPTGWTIVNTNSSTTWARSTAAGNAPTTGNSMKFDNYNVNDATNDEVHVTKFSTAAMTSSQLTFDVAYAPYNTTYFDGLEVLVSTDCGSTYTTVYSKSNTLLATRTATTSSFTPTAAQWRTETIDLTPYIGQNSVEVVFKNIAGNGNNLYIDNVNITGVTGTVTPPVSSFTTSTSTVCAGQTVSYTNTSTGTGNTYSWSFPGGTPSTSTATSPTVTYAAAGTYSVSLTATNTAGNNTSTQNNSITVNPTPTASISAGGPVSFCTGGSVTLTSSSASGNSWSNGSTSQSITVSTGGTYTVTVTSAGCSATSTGTLVTVNPNPTVNFGALGTTCTTSSPFTLTQGSPAGGTYTGNGVSSGQFNPATAGVGTTTITYNYTNANGCSNSATSSIVVNDCLGIDENTQTTVSIFPNPSTGFVTIKNNGQAIENVSVYNNVGQLVYTQKVASTEVDLNLTDLSNGMYTVRVQIANGVQNIPVLFNK